ncbi:hypothetical protein [Chryseobacterium sp. GVT01B]|uniref:hypothetical protein n=1 Tax=Chryseobacterium sp. GVT01B TaxID=2862675 RepID=UPI001CBAA9B4|nr:hypothetical protein [Chryseobacterium sp. GVT01B]
MKKTILYALLFSGIVFMAGAYIYHQYQYKKFENFFMNARLYGSGKIVPDTALAENYKKMGLNIKSYKYSIILKINDDEALGDVSFTTSFNSDFKITGGGSSGSIIGNHPIYGVKNSIYLKFIPEKWVPNKKSAFYLIVEYEKNKRIQYYFEMTEKLENKKYTIYFKSYPPKKILNVENQYIKD